MKLSTELSMILTAAITAISAGFIVMYCGASIIVGVLFTFFVLGLGYLFIESRKKLLEIQRKRDKGGT